MYNFSEKSRRQLASCHPQLQCLFNVVIQMIDCSIVEGHRTEEMHQQNMRNGLTKAKHSKHLYIPSLAVDVYPFKNGSISTCKYDCVELYGVVWALSKRMNIPIRWGGDWDRDGVIITDQKFNDLVHYELWGPGFNSNLRSW